WIRRSIKSYGCGDAVRARRRAVVARQAEHRTGVAVAGSRGDQRAGRVGRGNVGGNVTRTCPPRPQERLAVGLCGVGQVAGFATYWLVSVRVLQAVPAQARPALIIRPGASKPNGSR